MNKSKAIRFPEVMILTLVPFCALLWGIFISPVHQEISRSDTVAAVGPGNYGPHAANLADFDWSTTTHYKQAFDGDVLSGTGFYRLVDLERKLSQQAVVCAEIVVLFGIREMIFPTHFFW